MRRPGVVAVALLLAGCGDGVVDGGEDAVEAMVLETCAPGSTPVESEVCRCAYRELRERYDAEELEDLDRQLRDDPETVPAEVQEVVLACGFAVVAPPTTEATTTTSTTSTTSTTTRSRSSTSTTTSTTRLP